MPSVPIKSSRRSTFGGKAIQRRKSFLKGRGQNSRCGNRPAWSVKRDDEVERVGAIVITQVWKVTSLERSRAPISAR